MAERKNPIRLPHFACEVTSHSVAAVRCEGHVIAASHTRALAAGVLTPTLNAQNVHDPSALSEAIEQAISAVGGRGQDVVAILPDSAVRLTLLDFDSLPDRRQEAEAAIRFRLRKSLPFDIDKAAVSFDAQPTPQGLRVATTIVLNSVLEEYESAFRAASCSPGVVIPSSLAALGALDGQGASILLKLAPDASSVSVVNNNQLLLFRMLDGTDEATVSAQRLADDIYPSMVFFQDTYGGTLKELLVSGLPELATIAPALEEQTGAKVRELIASSTAPAALRHDFAGAVGALL